MIMPGKYTGKVVDYGLATDKQGNPIVEVHFAIEGQQGTVRWSGFMTEKNIERTLESLFYMGFTSADLSVLADGLASGTLSTTTEVNLTVEYQQKKVDGVWVNDTKYTQVKWVNKAGGTAKTLAPTEKAEVKNKLTALNGMLAQKRAEFGVKAAAKTIDL